MIFGAAYDSDAVVADGTPPVKVANPVTDYVPSARPGSRAPHAWIERDGRRVSTLDLLAGERFTLLAGPSGSAWCQAAGSVAERLRVPLQALSVRALDGAGDTGSRWPDAYGIESDGAVLVRPDGHVGWRHAGSAASPAGTLGQSLELILARRTPGRG